jgi:hypothetical protein
MQLNEYKIERWDVIYDEKLNSKQPLAYIVADQTLIEFANLNKDSLYATVKGTDNDCYDSLLNRVKVSLVSVKETRPNLFDQTGYYTLQFKNSIWLGYPKSMGTVSFEGVNKQKEDFQPPTQTQPTQQPQLQSCQQKSTIENFSLNSKPSLIIIVLAVLLLLVLAFRFLPKLLSR